jgi:hypothetical protein
MYRYIKASRFVVGEQQSLEALRTMRLASLACCEHRGNGGDHAFRRTLYIETLSEAVGLYKLISVHS